MTCCIVMILLICLQLVGNFAVVNEGFDLALLKFITNSVMILPPNCDLSLTSGTQSVHRHTGDVLDYNYSCCISAHSRQAVLILQCQHFILHPFDTHYKKLQQSKHGHTYRLEAAH